MVDFKYPVTTLRALFCHGVANGSSKILCELTRDFHVVLSPLFLAKDYWSIEVLQVCLIVVASISPVPCARLLKKRSALGKAKMD